jgi:tRNA pseudouridine13 synthase
MIESDRQLGPHLVTPLMSVVRKHESDEIHTEPLHKRLRLDEGEAIEGEELAGDGTVPAVGGGLLPPSHSLLDVPLREESSDAFFRLSESDVGISEYVGRDVPKIAGIIKQRHVQYVIFIPFA